MNFLLEKSAEHLEKGIACEEIGKIAEAKYNLLKAAEYLLKASEKAEGVLKQQRIERAEGIMTRAKQLDRQFGQAVPSPTASAEAVKPPSAWIVNEKPNLTLQDVAGLDDAKEQVRIKMIYPFTHPELAKRFGIKRGGGILLYGPPGTGKTMLARAVAGEIDAAFFTVKPSEIMSKWVGEAEQNIANLFKEARSHERSVIFIDEVEALIPKRSENASTVMHRVIPQILSEMEGFASSVKPDQVLLFMGATNEPWSLDDAVLRPGRFDEKIYIPLPDTDARKAILQANLKDKPLGPDVSLDEIVAMTEGFSGADLRRICEKASDIPFVESVKTGEERSVEKRDLLTVIQHIRPSVSENNLQKYDKFTFQ